jgi:hypothetical protein
MSYDSVDEGAEIRAGGSCAEVARGWNQRDGGGRDFVAYVRFVAASSVSIPRRGTVGRAAAAADRSVRHDYTQDAGELGQRSARACDRFWNNDQRDRATCHCRPSFSNPRASVSGREISPLSIPNLCLIVCWPRSLSRPTIPIGYASFAPAQML